MIFLDTSVLIDGFGGDADTRKSLRAALAGSEVIQLPSLVLYEWLRGPRAPEELEAQERLFPASRAVPFGTEAAQAGSDSEKRDGARQDSLDGPNEPSSGENSG